MRNLVCMLVVLGSSAMALPANAGDCGLGGPGIVPGYVYGYPTPVLVNHFGGQCDVRARSCQLPGFEQQEICYKVVIKFRTIEVPTEKWITVTDDEGQKYQILVPATKEVKVPYQALVPCTPEGEELEGETEQAPPTDDAPAIPPAGDEAPADSTPAIETAAPVTAEAAPIAGTAPQVTATPTTATPATAAPATSATATLSADEAALLGTSSKPNVQPSKFQAQPESTVPTQTLPAAPQAVPSPS